MSKCRSIIYYEYKMQMTRIASWGVLAASCIITLLDNLPVRGNLARLEFLEQPAYFIYRTMSLDALILIFGLVFLLASRIPIDKSTGMKALIMASPVTKRQYVVGKLLGGFFYTLSMLFIFLVLNTVAYLLVIPKEVSGMDCLVPFLKALFISGLPISLFISFISVAFPAVMDVRLFYLLAFALFFVNTSSVGSAGSMPFYLITSGDLSKLIWQHPKWPYTNVGGVLANILFLTGCGILAGLLLYYTERRKFPSVNAKNIPRG